MSKLKKRFEVVPLVQVLKKKAVEIGNKPVAKDAKKKGGRSLARAPLPRT